MLKGDHFIAYGVAEPSLLTVALHHPGPVCVCVAACLLCSVLAKEQQC